MSTPFSDPPDQPGCVVPDLQVAISEWASKGVGPFLTMRKVTLGGYRYEGRSSKPKLDVGFSQQGDLQIELIQPVNDEPSAYRDFSSSGRQWGPPPRLVLQRLCGRDRCGRTRWPRRAAARKLGAAHFIYYHPLSHDEMIGELIEMSDLSRNRFALIRSEAEQWDGRRPSRSLLGAADWGIRWTAVKVQVGTLLGRS